MITLKNIIKEYRTFRLDIKELNISDGEFVLIKGGNGSGKTTLINIIGLLDNRWSGEYLFNGSDIKKYNKKELCHIIESNFSYIFDNNNLIEEISFKDNLIYFRYDEKKFDKLVKYFGVSNLIDRRVSELSAGEKQIFSIIKGILRDSDIIICDEILNNLDDERASKVIEVLKELKDDGKSIIVVEHSDRLDFLADRMISLDNERIVDDKKINEKLLVESKNRKNAFVNNYLKSLKFEFFKYIKSKKKYINLVIYLTYFFSLLIFVSEKNIFIKTAKSAESEKFNYFLINDTENGEIEKYLKTSSSTVYNTESVAYYNVKFPDNTLRLPVYISDPLFLSKNGCVITDGKLFDDNSSDDVLVGKGLVEEYGYNPKDLLNSHIYIGDKKYKVSGIFDQKKAYYSKIFTDSVIIPADSLKSLPKSLRLSYFIRVEKEKTEYVLNELSSRGIIRANMCVIDLKESYARISSFNKFIILDLIYFIIAGLILLLISIYEKRRWFEILISYGFSKSYFFISYLINEFVIMISGFVIALLLAFVSEKILSFGVLDGLNAGVIFNYSLCSFVLLVLMSIIYSLLPGILKGFDIKSYIL